LFVEIIKYIDKLLRAEFLLKKVKVLNLPDSPEVKYGFVIDGQSGILGVYRTEYSADKDNFIKILTGALNTLKLVDDNLEKSAKGV